MKTTIQKVIETPLYKLQNEDAQNNWGDYNENQCCICGKKVGKNPKMVHYLTNGNIISSSDDVANSQGFFPIGNTCAKKIGVQFTF